MLILSNEVCYEFGYNWAIQSIIFAFVGPLTVIMACCMCATMRCPRNEQQTSDPVHNPKPNEPTYQANNLPQHTQAPGQQMNPNAMRMEYGKPPQPYGMNQGYNYPPK